MAAVTEARRAVTGPEACMLALKGSALGSKNALLVGVLVLCRRSRAGSALAFACPGA